MRTIRLGQTALAIALTTAALCGNASAQSVFATLYDFGAPVYATNLIAGPNGDLYGAADNGAFSRGTVFQLTPAQRAEPGRRRSCTVSAAPRTEMAPREA
jgi:hypothetical protein